MVDNANTTHCEPGSFALGQAPAARDKREKLVIYASFFPAQRLMRQKCAFSNNNADRAKLIKARSEEYEQVCLCVCLFRERERASAPGKTSDGELERRDREREAGKRCGTLLRWLRRVDGRCLSGVCVRERTRERERAGSCVARFFASPLFSVGQSGARLRAKWTCPHARDFLIAHTVVYIVARDVRFCRQTGILSLILMGFSLLFALTSRTLMGCSSVANGGKKRGIKTVLLS